METPWSNHAPINLTSTTTEPEHMNEWKFPNREIEILRTSMLA